MSRIIVKNLPKQTTENDIKKHFSKKGNLTDIKLKYRDGEFRRFAFLGFENPQEAQESCQFFNGTYLKQSQITVEVCHDIGSDQIQTSWSKRNKEKKDKTVKDQNQNDASLKESQTKKEKIKSKKTESEEAASLKEKLLEKYKDEPSFAEFLEVGEKGLKEDTKKKKKKKKGKESDSEADEGIGKEQEKISEDIGSNSEDDDSEEEDKMANKKEVSDMDYLKSLMKPSADVPTTEAAKTDVKPVETAKKKEKKWQELHTVVIRAHEMTKDKNSTRTFNKKNVKAFLKPLKLRSLRIPRQFRLVAYVGFKTEKEAKQALQKDKSFLEGVRVQVLKYEKPTGADSNKKGSSPWSVAEEKLKEAESVAESGKLFVRNLWYSVNEDLLRELFQQHGEISDVTLPICKVSRRPKGFATITFMFPEHAVAAMNALDGTSFKGRVLHILPAITKEEETKEGGLSFKEQKAKEQKATAGSWHNWNTLFLGSAAVVDVLAEKYNRSKQEILNSEGKQSLAVNLALGEAQIVDETKRFLEDNSVSLEAFTTPGVQRSSTVMLVKNLPAKTTAQELSELFGRYGELGRVLLPPSGISGIVEYLDPGEAKQGFRGLAYSRFKYLPLYLEWAPVQTFKTAPPPSKPKTEDDNDVKANSQNVEPKTEEKTAEQDTEDKPAPEANTTVYVKNLNFSTEENKLSQHFERVGQVHSVLIAKRRGLSQGYGFVQYIRKASTDRALRELQDSLLDDHTLSIKLSEKTLTSKVASSRKIQEFGKQTSSKIMVKNIPFQATHKEVKQLFATFGELKSVRLPDKPGSNEHRGFGFVEFITKEDARRAFETLGLSTHLYGRRLVLEWAKEEESVDELRKKTAERFLASGPPKKRTKLESAITPGKDEDSD